LALQRRDIGAVPVVKHGETGREDADGIGRYVDIGQLIEIRQISVIDRQAEGVLIDQADAGEYLVSALAEGGIAHQLAVTVRRRAEGVQLGRTLQEHAEDIVSRTDGRTIIVGEAGGHVEGIGLVAVRSHRGRIDRHHRAVGRIGRVVCERDGGVAVQHGAHVDVGGIVPPHVGEEVAADFCARADDHLGTLRQLADHQVDCRVAEEVEALRRRIPVGRIDRPGVVHAGRQRSDGGDARFIGGVLVHQFACRVANAHLRADHGVALSVDDAHGQLERAVDAFSRVANRFGGSDRLHSHEQHQKKRQDLFHGWVTPSRSVELWFACLGSGSSGRPIARPAGCAHGTAVPYIVGISRRYRRRSPPCRPPAGCRVQ